MFIWVPPIIFVYKWACYEPPEKRWRTFGERFDFRLEPIFTEVQSVTKLSIVSKWPSYFIYQGSDKVSDRLCNQRLRTLRGSGTKCIIGFQLLLNILASLFKYLNSWFSGFEIFQFRFPRFLSVWIFFLWAFWRFRRYKLREVFDLCYLKNILPQKVFRLHFKLIIN